MNSRNHFQSVMEKVARDLGSPKGDAVAENSDYHQNVGNRSVEADSAAKQVTVIGALANLILTLIKAVVGVVGHSAALVADAVHSAADMISDIVVWIAIIFGSREAD